jgi:hypothetical protein
MPLSPKYKKVDVVSIEAIITAPHLLMLAKLLLPRLLQLNKFAASSCHRIIMSNTNIYGFIKAGMYVTFNLVPND